MVKQKEINKAKAKAGQPFKGKLVEEITTGQAGFLSRALDPHFAQQPGRTEEPQVPVQVTSCAGTPMTPPCSHNNLGSQPMGNGLSGIPTSQTTPPPVMPPMGQATFGDATSIPTFGSTVSFSNKK